MALSVGSRLGPYEVLGLLGAGGMGEVYRARDTRLERTVALKVLAPATAGDGTRRARFESEARTIAQLTHPHICTLYDVGVQDDVTYLVMEHLAGETLAARVRRGPLPVAQVLAIGAQIADALAAAHKAGIVHRDLKPSNVMLVGASAGPVRGGRPSGPPDSNPGQVRWSGPSGAPFVKLLDFGLAKLRAHGETPAVTLAGDAPEGSEPTLTAPGTIVGTLPYMAPEQLQGQETDARTDLWALGTILYELLTGVRAFEADSAASLVGAILEREPAPISARQPLTPPSLERVVRRCLAKHPDDRWDTAHDVADELRWIAQGGSTGAATVLRARWRRLAQAGLALLAVPGATAIGWYWHAASSMVVTSARPVTRLMLDAAPAERVHGGGTWLRTEEHTAGGARTAFAWTPDGKALVFAGLEGDTRQLYLRSLDSSRARAIGGTTGAQVPAVSPDGQFVAFWRDEDKLVYRVPLTGGPAERLVDAMCPAGIAWAADGTLFVGATDVGRKLDASGTGPIAQVARNGAVSQATKLGETEIAHQFPFVVPGDRVLIYTVRRRLLSWGGDEEVVAQVRATGERKSLLKDATDARYVSTGHLLFMRRGVLFAVPFDPDRIEVNGDPVPVVDGVAQALLPALGGATGAGQFAVSAVGTLAWLSGPVVEPPNSTMIAVDRSGRETPIPAPPHPYGPALRVSPDGGRLAVTVATLGGSSVWIYDLGRGTLSALMISGDVTRPVWTPDGRRLVFDLIARGRRGLAWQPADASAAPETLASGDLVPSSWSADGRQLVGSTSDGNLWAGTLQGSALALQWLPKAGWQFSPVLSPDGRYLVYRDHTATGFPVIYARPFAGPGPRVQASAYDNGLEPAWNPNGRELFYLAVSADLTTLTMMTVAVDRSSGIAFGPARKLFEKKGWDFPCSPTRCYDVSPDGQRFYFVTTPGWEPAKPVTHIRVVQNWVEELTAKVPSRSRQ